MQANKRSIYNGTIVIGDLRIPICVYKTVDIYGIPGQLYHDDCGGKVHQKKFCEIHPDEEELTTFSAIVVGEKLIRVDSEIRNELLNRKCAFTAVSTHPLRTITELLGTKDMLPIYTLEIAPMKSEVAALVGLINNQLHTLLARLARRKDFLMCKFGAVGMERYAMLLPNGRLIVLAYNEEVRVPEEWSGNYVLNADMDMRLNSLGETYPDMSLRDYADRVENWIMSHILPTKKSPTSRSRNTKKNPKPLRTGKRTAKV